MFKSKTKTQPSHYPRLSFHLIRLCSLLSSLVVSAIMFYFMYHLTHDHFKIPWTFLLLMGVSLLTLAMLVFTSLLHCCHVLSPLLSLTFSIPLFLLWTLALGLLGWNMSGTLGHVCNTANWGDGAGIMICRIYKALFSFSVTGFVSAFAAVVLDIKVRRRQTRRGAYNMMTDDQQGGRSRDMKMGGLSSGNYNQSTPEIVVEPYRNEGAEGVPTQPEQQRFYNGVTERVGWKPNSTIRAREFGYAAPSEQTTYDGGSYGHGR